jgi:hypothetical protein
MSSTSGKPDVSELRSEFLKESKKFCKALEYEPGEMDSELKGQILHEMRQKLKSLLQMINELEKEESGKPNL